MKANHKKDFYSAADPFQPSHMSGKNLLNNATTTPPPMMLDSQYQIFRNILPGAGQDIMN